jgi:hypothetical protein
MNCSNDKTSCASKCIKIALLVILGIAALGGVVMLLWNWLMPALFAGARPVDYCQALGLLLLSKILFGGFRGGHHKHCKNHHKHFENMTPEEREQLKSQYKSRWSKWCCSEKGEDQTPVTSTTPRE